MSTRCCVRVIQNNNCILSFYHHSDGYPSYMIRDLYQVIAHTKVNAVKSGKDYFELSDMKDAFDNAGGYKEEEFCVSHGDLEYFWIVKVNDDYTNATVFYSDEHLEVSDYLNLNGVYNKEADKWLIKCEMDEECKPCEYVNLDLPDDVYEKLAKQAEKENITMEKLVNKILKDAIETGELEKIVKESLQQKK